MPVKKYYSVKEEESFSIKRWRISRIGLSKDDESLALFYDKNILKIFIKALKNEGNTPSKFSVEI